MCFFNGIQHSASYNRTDSTQTWYTPLLIFKIKFLSLKSVFFKTPKTWDAFVIHISSSSYIHPTRSSYSYIRDPRYGNSSTQHKSPPFTDIDSLSLYTLIHIMSVCTNNQSKITTDILILPNRQLYSRS